MGRTRIDVQQLPPVQQAHSNGRGVRQVGQQAAAQAWQKAAEIEKDINNNTRIR
jgi:hypothetical protein